MPSSAPLRLQRTWRSGGGASVVGVDQPDIAIRNLTYRMFVENGRAPTVGDVAAHSGSSVDDISAAWLRLHDAHAIVLFSGTTELRMANPFAATETAYRVSAAGRSWYANCAWDAFGICAALHSDGRIETACAECGEPILCEVRDGHVSDEDLLFHCLVPAARWWDDIVLT